MTSPAPLTEAEQAATEVLSHFHNCRAEIGFELEADDFADEARAVVAAVREPIADETALQLGRDCLRDGLVPFLTRLVGEANADRLLAPILAEALSQSAGRLIDQADRVRQKFPSQPIGWNRTYGLSEAASMLRADAQSLSLPASKETPQ